MWAGRGTDGHWAPEQIHWAGALSGQPMNVRMDGGLSFAIELIRMFAARQNAIALQRIWNRHGHVPIDGTQSGLTAHPTLAMRRRQDDT